MFRAELGALGKRVSAALGGCFELDGLATGDLDGPDTVIPVRSEACLPHERNPHEVPRTCRKSRDWVSVGRTAAYRWGWTEYGATFKRSWIPGFEATPGGWS